MHDPPTYFREHKIAELVCCVGRISNRFFGVFMGLQVQDWKQARKERIDEHELLSRFYEETLGLLDAQREDLVDLNARADVLMGVISVLFSQEPPRVISGEECENITGSHVFRRPPDKLPVLDEMLSTGRFDVLQDKVIKEKLRSYVIFAGVAEPSMRKLLTSYFDCTAGSRASLQSAGGRRNLGVEPILFVVRYTNNSVRPLLAEGVEIDESDVGSLCPFPDSIVQ